MCERLLFTLYYFGVVPEIIVCVIVFLRFFKFYLPFIVMGQWISSKYARANIVAYVLDVLVELPLKTVLRLVRQWVRFLNEKHEEIL